MDAYGEFELDIPKVMRESLPQFFASRIAYPLLPANIQEIPESAQGAYCLFLNGQLVYVGKTDAEAGFRQRLTRHYFNIQHRKGLDPNCVSFKAVRVFVFSTFDLETMLIKYYTEEMGARPEWNASGFGSNDPGHNREDQDPARFDVCYPVDIDRELVGLPIGDQSVLTILTQLKNLLPYTFRFESDAPGRSGRRSGHADMRNSMITLPGEPLTSRTIIQACLNAMGQEWQATVLPNRVIIYKESRVYRAQIEALKGGA